MKSIVGIYDSNSDYAERLFGFINGNMNIGCSAVLFDTFEGAISALKNGAVAVLLLEEEHAKDLTDMKNIWLLSEQKMMNQQADAVQTIYKYMNAYELIGACLGWSDKAAVETSIYTVYCPGSNSLGERYAREKASDLSISGKTLFISWEMFGGFERDTSDTVSLSEILYFAHGSEKGLTRSMSNIKSMEGYYYLSGVDYYEDLWHYQREDIEPFLNLVKDKGKFSNVVILIGFLSETVEGLLAESETIYLVKESAGDRRFKDFMRQFKYAGKQDIISKIREVSA